VSMSRNETIFIRLFIIMIFIPPLYGDITIGLLTSIQSNVKQSLLYRNSPLSCEPFGVITLEKMTQNTANVQECKSLIETFYQSHPHEKKFADEKLKIQQSYHYEMIKEGCVLYANGAESYSEMLLREGLALVDPKFDNKEWNGKLKKAEKGAKTEKIGLRDTLIEKFCIKQEQ
jgi:hypothetical protein